MSRDPRADCANSGTGAPTPAGVQPHEAHEVICTRCKRGTHATAGTDGYSTLWVHLRPGKTLADRRT